MPTACSCVRRALFVRSNPRIAPPRRPPGSNTPADNSAACSHEETTTAPSNHDRYHRPYFDRVERTQRSSGGRRVRPLR